MMKINFDRLMKKAGRIALKVVRREIDRILAKPDLPKDVAIEPTDEGMKLAGKNLKSRAVSDPKVRNIAR
jgi:hypothetical protein